MRAGARGGECPSVSFGAWPGFGRVLSSLRAGCWCDQHRARHLERAQCVAMEGAGLSSHVAMGCPPTPSGWVLALLGPVWA